MRVTKKTEKKQPRAKAAKKTVKTKTVKTKTAPKPRVRKQKTQTIPKIAVVEASGPITVKFSRVDFEKTLAVARDFVEKGGTMPILTHVYLGITEVGCRLIATNLDRFWSKNIDCKPGGPVNRCVPVEVLYSEVKALPADIELAELSFDEHTVSVNNRCQIETLPGNDFPAMPDGGSKKAEITDLVVKTKRVLPAAGDSDTRYTLNTVCINLQKGHIAATDGHRLHIDDIEAYMDSPQLLVPTSTMQLAVKHGASDTVKYSKQHINFEVAGGTLVSRLVEGTYPDYENIIPKKNPITTRFSGTEMLKIMEGAIPLSRRESKAVRLTINGQIKVDSMNPDLGQYSWSLPCKTEGNKGKDLVIGISAKFLIDAIKAYTSKEDDSVIMELNESLSPILINSKAVVMPMRT